LNKCDIFEKLKLERKDILTHVDYDKFKHISLKKTIAIEGEGVLDSFSQLIKFIFPQLKVNLCFYN